MPRLGLFGGSFNPPHVAHLAVAEALAEALDLAQVCWMPAATSPFKQGRSDMADAAHRLAMVRLATADNPRFTVSDLEIQRAGISYTYDTLVALQAQRPGERLVLLVGSDSLAAFDRWHRAADILDLAEVAVYPRPGTPLDALDPALRARVTPVDAPLLDLSSTWLRDRLRAGRSVRYLVPEAVRAYLETHDLYRS